MHVSSPQDTTSVCLKSCEVLPSKWLKLHYKIVTGDVDMIHMSQHMGQGTLSNYLSLRALLMWLGF